MTLFKLHCLTLRTAVFLVASASVFASSAWSAEALPSPLSPSTVATEAALPQSLRQVQRVEPALVPASVATTEQLRPRPAIAPQRTRIALERPDPLRSAQAAQQEHRAGVPVTIGFPREVPGLRNSTETLSALNWQPLPGGRHVAAIGIDSPEAKALRLGVRVFSLPAEARLRVYGPDADKFYEVTGQEILATIDRNLAASASDEEARTWWAPSVEGTETVLEIELPAGVDPNDVQLAIPRVSHLFAGIQLAADIGRAASCNVDAMCYQGTWDNVSRATAHIEFVSSGSTMICSGTLLNDKDTTTAIPYFVTAYHCISGQIEASSLASHWFFRSSGCNSRSLSPAYQAVRGGATYLFGDSGTDIALLRLNANPPAGAAFAGWSSAAPAVGAPVTSLHNPQGDLQKISLGSISGYLDCHWGGISRLTCYSSTPESGDHLQVNWTAGTTEPGSSGGGLFLNNGQYFVGTLHAASPACEGNGYAFYGRFDQAYAAGLDKYLENGAAARYALTVTKAGTGTGTVTGTDISCGAKCSANFVYGATVTLTATPAAGSVFSGWSGACSNGSGNCVANVEGKTDVVAEFSLAGEMLQRDAIYLYNKPLYANAHKAVLGHHCDVFQLLLSVKSGFTDLAMYDSYLSNYRDRLAAGAPMFAYSLYSAQPDKAFRLANNSYTSTNEQIGSATFFAYCFSTRLDAYVAYYDDTTKTCTRSNGKAVNCADLKVIPKLPKLAPRAP